MGEFYFTPETLCEDPSKGAWAVLSVSFLGANHPQHPVGAPLCLLQMLPTGALCLQVHRALKPTTKLLLAPGPWTDRSEVDMRAPVSPRDIVNQVKRRYRCYLFTVQINRKQFLQHWKFSKIEWGYFCFPLDAVI